MVGCDAFKVGEEESLLPFTVAIKYRITKARTCFSENKVIDLENKTKQNIAPSLVYLYLQILTSFYNIASVTEHYHLGRNIT